MVVLSNKDNDEYRSGMLDYLSRLKAIIEEHGDIKSVYGGFEITVRDSFNFPWNKVLTLLVDLDHEVWIEKEEDYLIIKTKPPSI